MTLKKPVTKKAKKLEYDEENFRAFQYPYVHFSTYSMVRACTELRDREMKMLIGVIKLLEKNSNMILNLAGRPAESRTEIIAGLGYLQPGQAPLNTIKKLFDADIIKKTPRENTFTGYAFYLNPYVYYYGSTVDDTTLELFQDSRWKT